MRDEGRQVEESWPTILPFPSFATAEADTGVSAQCEEAATDLAKLRVVKGPSSAADSDNKILGSVMDSCLSLGIQRWACYSQRGFTHASLALEILC